MRKKLLCSPALLAFILVYSAAASAQTAPYTRTVIVPSNGTPTANGTALVTAETNVCNSRPIPDPGAGERLGKPLGDSHVG